LPSCFPLLDVDQLFKVTGEHFTDPPTFAPPRIHFKAYEDALKYTGGKGLQDSLIVATSTMVLRFGLGCLGAYAVARYRWGGKNSSSCCWSSDAAPCLDRVPLFILFDKLKLLDTYQGLILADTVFNLPYAIWLLQGFFQEDSDRDRGSSHGRRQLPLAGVHTHWCCR